MPVSNLKKLIGHTAWQQQKMYDYRLIKFTFSRDMWLSYDIKKGKLYMLEFVGFGYGSRAIILTCADLCHFNSFIKCLKISLCILYGAITQFCLEIVTLKEKEDSIV